MSSVEYYAWAYRFVAYLFRFYEITLLAYILLSWFPNFRENVIIDFIKTISEPYLSIFRKIIPPIGMLDVSPILAFLVLGFIERGIFMLLF